MGTIMLVSATLAQRLQNSHGFYTLFGSSKRLFFFIELHKTLLTCNNSTTLVTRRSFLGL